MPTGYTAEVVNSDDYTFQEFALSCARAFGALITMRDDPMDAPIPDEFGPSDFYAKSAKDAQSEYTKLVGMSLDEQIAYGVQKRLDEIQSSAKYLKESALENERIYRMTAQVRDWTPPTPEHVNMKNFMLEQLSLSLNDMAYCYKSIRNAENLEPLQVYKDALDRASKNITYYEEESAKEKARARERTIWVRQLKQSLNINPSEIAASHD